MKDTQKLKNQLLLLIGLVFAITGNTVGEARAEVSLQSKSLKDYLGITYFTFFYGPGLAENHFWITPNQLGKPENDGIYTQNQVSLRYKLWDNLALDLQFRFKLIFNNETHSPKYHPFRWEAPRIGFSGTLLEGENWSLTGAVNTDFPYFLPFPFTGYQAQQRTVIFNPGMFASLKYKPKASRWSIYSVVSPRIFFYEDRSAGEYQLNQSGMAPRTKPEIILAFQPTLNYSLSEVTALSLGTTIDYRKYVLSSWNIFNASIITNGDDPAWRLGAVPLSVGVTYEIASNLTIFPYVATYPIAIQRLNTQTGKQASILEASSVGMWLRGTLF